MSARFSVSAPPEPGSLRRVGRPLALGGLFLVLFLALALVVQSGVLHAADRAILVAIQAPTFEVLLELGSVLSAVGAVEIELPLVAIGAIILWWRGRRAAALALAGLFPVSLLSAVLKNVVDQPGVPPELFRGFARLPSGDLQTLGTFPSGHMLRAGYLGGVALIGLSHRSPSRRRSFLVVATLLGMAVMALSRPYLGEHWPSDLLGGLLLAAAPLPLVAHFWRSVPSSKLKIPREGCPSER